jgi:hypothetical protein
MTVPTELDLPRLALLAAAVAWPAVLVLGWWIRRRLLTKYERLGESSSDEMLAELASAYAPRRGIRIVTPTEYLPFVFEGIREVVDGGFDDRQMRSLLERIDFHRPHDFRQAVFPVEVGGRRSDLLFQWSRDGGDRIRLRITAAPRIIQALRDQKRRIPKASFVA